MLHSFEQRSLSNQQRKNHPAVEAFTAHVKKICQENHVRLHMPQTKEVICTYGDTQTRFAGFFDDKHPDGPILSVGIGRPFDKWFPIFIHEFNHLMQWLEKSPLYTALDQHPNIYKWFNNEVRLSPRRSEQGTKAVRACELDCEIRTIQMIQERQLPFDTKQYARKSCCYLYLYQFVEKYQFWPECPSQKTSRIVGQMPDTLSPNEADYVNDGIMALYEKCYRRELLQHQKKSSKP